MDKLGSTFRLLSLVSVFFIYKAIAGAISNNTNEITIWALITIIYIVSLAIMYYVAKRWKKEQSM